MPAKDIERIAYYESYVVIQPGKTGLQEKDLITEEQYNEALDTFASINQQLDDDDPNKFIALIGGEAIKELLRKIDPDKTYRQLKDQIKYETSQLKKADIFKRLRVLDSFRQSNRKLNLKNEPH
jgi:DNA-directed RNA polymerase subunit beta'